MSNMQQLVDEAMEQYEELLESDQDEQNVVGDLTEREMKGLKLHSLRNGAWSLFPEMDNRHLTAMMESAWMDEHLYNVQWEIVQRKVKTERAMHLFMTAGQVDEVA